MILQSYSLFKVVTYTSSEVKEGKVDFLMSAKNVTTNRITRSLIVIFVKKESIEGRFIKESIFIKRIAKVCLKLITIRYIYND